MLWKVSYIKNLYKCICQNCSWLICYVYLCILPDKDVARTDRTQKFFSGDRNQNLQVLYDILMTYCMYNFDLGKCFCVCIFYLIRAAQASLLIVNVIKRKHKLNYPEISQFLWYLSLKSHNSFYVILYMVILTIFP